MRRHAISYEARNWTGWPSMQKASKMLADRMMYPLSWSWSV